MSANPYSPPMGGGYAMGPSAGATSGAGPTEMSVEMLRQTRPWVLFLSVMSFIGAAFMLFGGVLMMIMGAVAGASTRSGLGAVPGALLGALYIPFGLLYLYPAIKMWQYGSSIGRLVASRQNEDLEAALANQKSLWKYAGIMTIVTIVLYVLAIIGMVVVGIAGAARMH